MHRTAACTPLHHAVACVTVGMGPDAAHGADGHPSSRIHVSATEKARSWIKMWDAGLQSIKGFSEARLAELRREVQSIRPFHGLAQILLDACTRFDLRDATGRVARICQAGLRRLAGSEDVRRMHGYGKTYLVKGDLVTAKYLEERGTKFEHGNLWEMVSSAGVRCQQGYPRMNGSRAYQTRHVKVFAAGGGLPTARELKIGQAGELQRRMHNIRSLPRICGRIHGLTKEACSPLRVLSPSPR